ncbi:hypothetical protein CEXT_397281 [Caerostris extrusa]|uniref:Uncharacterized protein n=1 Tax=Caerostris extrusa TaxID=172846 RepID=A0AAV4XDR3_CAEEX|nr:hypothetical protein CEXT_397281 [Caerostris extrusa]
MKREIGICWCAPGSGMGSLYPTLSPHPPLIPPPRHPFFVEPVAFRSEGDLISQRQLVHSIGEWEYRYRDISDCGILDSLEMKRRLVSAGVLGSTPEWVLCTPLPHPPIRSSPSPPLFRGTVAFRSEGDLISQRCQLGHSGDKRGISRSLYIRLWDIGHRKRKKAGDIF